jgi:stage V sporulation protein G
MTEPMSGNASVPAGTADMMPPAAAPQQEQLPTQVTVKIHSIRTTGNLLATASANLNGVFAIRGIRVVRGPDGPFVAMPQRRVGEEYRDVCFPCTTEFYDHFKGAVLEAYQQELSQMVNRGQEAAQQGAYAPVMSM